MVKSAFKGVAWFIGLLVVFALPFAVINHFDEDLSPETLAQSKMLPEIPPSENNAYIYFLGLDAPLDQPVYGWGSKVLEAYRASNHKGFASSPEWKKLVHSKNFPVEKLSWCKFISEKSCLSELETISKSGEILKRHALLLQRYQIMRDKPEFLDLYVAVDPSSILPSYSKLSQLQQLTQLEVFADIKSRKFEDAVRKMEREVEFHRRMLAGAKLVYTKNSAILMLMRDGLFISEMVKAQPVAFAHYKGRLANSLRPLDKDEANTTYISNELKNGISILADMNFESFDFYMNLWTDFHWYSPFLNRVLWLGYRPHATANFAAQHNQIEVDLAEAAPTDFLQQSKLAAAKHHALDLEKSSFFVNPMGNYIISDVHPDISSAYVPILHDLRGLLALLSLQIELMSNAPPSSSTVSALLAGPKGAQFANPYTGKPMDYDATKNTISFTPQGRIGITREMKKRFSGQMAVQP